MEWPNLFQTDSDSLSNWWDNVKCTFWISFRGLWHYEHDGQRNRTIYTVPQVDKGTSLYCYYVKMCWTCENACDTCSTHFYIIAVKGCSFVYLRNCIFCPLSLSVMWACTKIQTDYVRRLLWTDGKNYSWGDLTIFEQSKYCVLFKDYDTSCIFVTVFLHVNEGMDGINW